jgi:hypothetical protein
MVLGNRSRADGDWSATGGCVARVALFDADDFSAGAAAATEAVMAGKRRLRGVPREAAYKGPRADPQPPQCRADH